MSEQSVQTMLARVAASEEEMSTEARELAAVLEKMHAVMGEASDVAHEAIAALGEKDRQIGELRAENFRLRSLVAAQSRVMPRGWGLA